MQASYLLHCTDHTVKIVKCASKLNPVKNWNKICEIWKYVTTGQQVIYNVYPLLCVNKKRVKDCFVQNAVFDL